MKHKIHGDYQSTAMGNAQMLASRIWVGLGDLDFTLSLSMTEQDAETQLEIMRLREEFRKARAAIHPHFNSLHEIKR